MKYFIITIIIVALLAAVTNPDPVVHKEILKTKLRQHLKESMANHNGSFWEEAGEFFGNLLGGAAVDMGVDHMIAVDNYTLFSLSTITWDGATEIIGVGAFGQVFLVRDFHDITRKNNPDDHLEPI